MVQGYPFKRLVLAGLAVALTAGVCAADPPSNVTTNMTAPAKPAKPAKAAKSAKPSKFVIADEAAAIEAGKEACLPISETYKNEHWRAQNQHGVWRVWVTPVHCEGGGTCPTYEVHVTQSDGVAGECTQRIALN